MDAAISFENQKASSAQMAKRILSEIMSYRRVPRSHDACQNVSCSKCATWHLPKIMESIELGEPVSFVLPAFPGKSPNPEKVLGALPDFAERLSLLFLASLCRKVKHYYAPGIRILLCSDGRVFSDVVGMKESDVTAYQIELDRLIDELQLADLSTFNLDNHFGNLSFAQMREELMESYGTSLEMLRTKIQAGATSTGTLEEQEANRMYRGITRFMFEDSLFPGQTKSKTALQAEARAKAYEVIRRSNAWSDLIAERFPRAVRLSIHPQGCGAKKLGIRLIADESWMTPWHGVAIETPEGYVLLKRSKAEALRAELVLSPNGRPSHYKLATSLDLHEGELV
jgi:pyoverdine/dityrosine biosynthesis protein Dit1